MDIGSLFLLLGLFILIGIYISRPFFLRRSTLVSKEDQDLSAMLAEKERLLNAIQELDFDFSLQKIPTEDYPAQRSVLLARTVQVMQKIDHIRQENGTDIEGNIEASLAARRKEKDTSPTTPRKQTRRGVMPGGQPDDELEAMIAARRREQNVRAAGFCPQCGKPVLQTDRYCPKCGALLAVEEISQG